MEAVLSTVSWTQLNMFSTCAVRYKFRYPMEIIRPPGIAAYKGGGADAGINLNLQHKIDHEMTPAPLDAVCDAAHDEVVNRIRKEGVMLTEEERARGLGVVTGETADGAVRLAKLHYENLAPKIVPVSVQHTWSLDYAAGNAVITGRWDAEVERGIRDTKCPKTTPPEDAADKSDQLRIYGMSWFKEHGDTLPDFLALDCLVDLKRGPEIVTRVTRPTRADFDKVLARIDAFLGAIRAGIFVPMSRSSYLCSPTYCGYFDLCPYV